MPQVTMPDGQVVDMPDKLSPELAERLKAFNEGGQRSPAAPLSGGMKPMSQQEYLDLARQHQEMQGVHSPENIQAGLEDYIRQKNALPSKIQPPGSETIGDKVQGLVGAGANMAGGVLSAPLHMVVPESRSTQGYHDWLDKQFQSPVNEAGGRYLQKVGNFLEPLSALPPDLTMGLPQAAMRDVAMSAPAVRNAASRVSDAARNIRAPGAGLISDLRGNAIAPAKSAAGESARSAVGEAAITAEAQATREMTQAENLESLRSRLDQHLESQRNSETIPDLDRQGNDLRNAVNTAYDAAKKNRAKQANTEFSAAKSEAAAREAIGERVNTSDVESDLTKLREQVKGIPALENKVDEMLSSIHSGRAEPVAAPGQPAPTTKGRSLREILREPEGVLGKPRAPGEPPPVAPAKPQVPQGKTFDQLEIVRRYLNDVAYSGNLEGYPSIARNAAREAAHKLDKAMQDFVPSFKQYKENYAKNSEPLHSLDTRLGRAVTGTEGGLAEDAYAKTAAQDLPGKIFSKKEGIDTVVDALAGGKNATPDARAAAQKTIDNMVENWITEKTRGMTGEAASKELSAPGMRAATSAVPKVAEKLGARFESRAALEQQSKDLAKSAQSASKRSADSTEISNKMRQDLENSDILSKMDDVKSKNQALDGYMGTLARARNAGLIAPEKYKAALDLVSRANTLEERTARARRIAKAIIGVGVAATIGKELAAPGS